jgi:transposase-like protein
LFLLRRGADRYQRQPDRVHTRYGHQQGVATLAGQKVAITRPRVRQADSGGELPLEMYARLQSPDAMPNAVRRRMVHGVGTREYEQFIDLARDGFGVAKSSVSREFVRASAAQVKALAERRFDGQRFPVVMIDGVEYAGETIVVAMGITEDDSEAPRPRRSDRTARLWRATRTSCYSSSISTCSQCHIDGRR